MTALQVDGPVGDLLEALGLTSDGTLDGDFFADPLPSADVITMEDKPTSPRQYSRGNGCVSFTFSKSINYADNSDSGPSWNGPSMYSRNKGQAGFNRPKNLQIYFVQPVPFGKGHRLASQGILGKVAGGWQLNGIFSVMQGRPFTVGSSATTVNTVGNAQTADQVKEDVEFFGNVGRGESYFDPNAFVPPTGNLDGSIFRSFRVREKASLQFRWEVFNLSNTPAFGNPGATASSATRNTDGTVRTTGGFTEITSASATERRMRFAIKILF